MICGGAELSWADDRLARTCAQALRQTNDPARLRAEQRRWLGAHGRRSAPACLDTAHTDGITALEKGRASAQSEPLCQYGMDAAQA